MNRYKLFANIVFGALLALSLFISWKALDLAGDAAFSGKQPLVWINIVSFVCSILLVCIAIYVKAKYGK